MAWIYLIIAGLCEAGWAISLKYTCGFTRFWPSVGTVICLITSFVMFSVSLKSLPIGTAYAIWTGIGAAGTVIVGIFVFGEARDMTRICCILLIVAGIVGLKLTSSQAG
jgi:quaternary ammonium compound-resistance protein SugE